MSSEVVHSALAALIGVTAPSATLASEAWRAAPTPPILPAALLETTKRHGMILPLAHAFTGDPRPAARAGAAMVAPTARARTLLCLAVTQALIVLAKRFADAGLPMLAIKGPALSQDLFASPTKRDPGDIDLMIRPTDLAAADRLLHALGYVRAPRWQSAFAAGEEARILSQFFHVDYRHPETKIVVEAHWRWFHIEEILPYSEKIIWSNSRLIQIGGASIPVLSAEAQFFYISFHAAKHECERLKWVHDLAWLLSTCDDAVVRGAVEIARTLDSLDLFLAPLLLTADLGAAILPSSLADLAHRPHARRLAALFRARLLHSPPMAENGTLRQKLRWQRTYWRLAVHRDDAHSLVPQGGHWRTLTVTTRRWVAPRLRHLAGRVMSKVSYLFRTRRP